MGVPSLMMYWMPRAKKGAVNRPEASRTEELAGPKDSIELMSVRATENVALSLLEEGTS
jgi:hypothetical protein